MLEGAHPRPADINCGCGEELRANFRVFPLIVNSQVCSLLVAVGTKGCRSFAATIYSTDEAQASQGLLVRQAFAARRGPNASRSGPRVHASSAPAAS